MALLRFYDLPVYRLDNEGYNAEYARYIESARRKLAGPASAELLSDELLGRGFGGSWLFNEIIGYIRLHFRGTQILGEYYSVSRRRIVRSRSKIIDLQSWKLAPEVDISSPYRTPQVLAAINAYIAACRREVPHRFIDASLFDVISPHVDWEALLAAALQSPRGEELPS